MGRNRKYTIEQKKQVVEDVQKLTLYKWVALYDDYGETGYTTEESKTLIEKYITFYIMFKHQ